MAAGAPATTAAHRTTKEGKMSLRTSRTPKGCAIARFRDWDGQICLVSEAEPGDSPNPLLLLGPAEGGEMRLTQGQVADLLPLLGLFVERGHLPPVPLHAPPPAAIASSATLAA
jgi:hypothetical protein